MNRRLLDYVPEVMPSAPSASAPAQLEEGLEEGAEMEHGAALLEAGAGPALGRFLARLVAGAGPAGRAALRGPLGAALLPALDRAARAALPRDMADLKRKAATIFGLELEGLSPEDKEFALARQVTRLLRAVVDGALAPGGAADPATRVQAALVLAARRHAPGLLRQGLEARPRGGAWRREGGRLVVLDC
ncbi:hypothetical protein [Pseudoduganella namucuonensis]|uniref:Uncharacterized protein n=1 Tax=Pseudoduganella namucuonensis TaxID=1035707 RepID=A0A1I7HP59_9BURK|nr:hypothetical protein [Pseudoduganella namucuonensis]SFU62421.1 hypothetical protein SAMN05216552_100678 [Pseudoduganella namucuonensis]